MARIQTPQHVQELQATFKVREPFGLELLETIQPTYSLGAQKVASTGYPRNCFGVVVGAAGGVGTNVECALRCPADVGIVILLTKVLLINVAASIDANMTDGVAMTPIVDQQLGAFQDGRLSGQLPVGIMETANPLTAAPNGFRVALYGTQADELVQIPLNVILGGDAYFLIRNRVANLAQTINFEWTEFLLEDR